MILLRTIIFIIVVATTLLYFTGAYAEHRIGSIEAQSEHIERSFISYESPYELRDYEARDRLDDLENRISELEARL